MRIIGQLVQFIIMLAIVRIVLPRVFDNIERAVRFVLAWHVNRRSPTSLPPVLAAPPSQPNCRCAVVPLAAIDESPVEEPPTFRCSCGLARILLDWKLRRDHASVCVDIIVDGARICGCVGGACILQPMNDAARAVWTLDETLRTMALWRLALGSDVERRPVA